MSSTENPPQIDKTQEKVAPLQTGASASSPAKASVNKFDTKYIALDSLTSEEIFEVKLDLHRCFLPLLHVQLSLQVLQKPHNMRTDKDILLLEKCTANVKFFIDLANENGPDLHRQCCQRLDLHFCEAGQVVFNLGESGKTFYITLRGSVGVYINLPKPITDPNEFPQLVLTEVKVMPAGTAFGELALMSNKPRAATIIAKEDTYFAILDKDPFDRILKETQEKKLIDQLQFFAKMKMFSQWSHSLLQKMFLQTALITTNRNQIIYSENEPTKDIYFIKSGEFKVFKTLEIQPDETSEAFKRNNKMLRCGNKFCSRYIELAILTVGEMFGEEDIITDSKRQNTVKCFSHEGELYALSKKDFFRRIFSEEIAKQYIIKRLDWKREVYSTRINKILNTTTDHKEFLMQVTETKIYKPFELLYSGSPKTKAKPLPNEPKEKQRKDRIRTLSPTNSHENSVLSAFNGFGGQAPQIQDSSKVKKEPQKVSAINPITQPAAEIQNKYTNRMDDYMALAVKRDRPRNYKEFRAIDEDKRARIIDFGVPPSLLKTNPMTIALKKDKERRASMQNRSMLNNSSRNLGVKCIDLVQPQAERSAYTDRQTILGRIINDDEHSGDPEQDQGFMSQKNHKVMDKRQAYGSLEPIRGLPSSRSSLSHNRENEFRPQDEYLPQSSAHRFSPSNKHEQVRVKSSLIRSFKKTFQTERLRDDSLDKWMEHSRKTAQNRIFTERSVDKESLNLYGKNELNNVQMPGDKPFEQLPEYILRRLEGKKMDKRSQRNNSMPHHVKETRLNTSTDEPESTAMYSKKGASSQNLNRSQYTTGRGLNTSINSSRLGNETSTLNLSTNPWSDRNASLPSDNFVINTSSVGPMPSIKPKFALHGLKMREFKNETNEVRSLLNIKRFGAE